MAQTATIKIKIRRDTEANWRAVNPILLEGEIGFAKDAAYFVIGNGTQAFNDLSPIATNALSSSRFRSEQAFLLKSVFDADNDGVIDRAETIQITVRNSNNFVLTKGQVVYLSGATGNRPNALLANASSEATSSKTIGIVAENIQSNGDGLVTVVGTMHDLDTSAFADGVAVWLSSTVNGGLTSTVPVQPNHAVFIGYIARSHPTQGRLVLKIQNGYELNELHNVLVTNVANNEVLTFETSSNLWKNKTLLSALGYTPANIAGDTFTGAISATNLSGTNTGDETTASIKTKLGVASATQDGYLTMSNWTTFNSKQNALGYTPANRAGDTFSGSIFANNLTGTNTGDETTATIKTKLGIASASQDGYLTSANWTTFNSKQNALGYTPANIAGDTFTGAISASNLSGTNTGDETTSSIKTKLGAATTSQDGYLTSADWNHFNNKLDSPLPIATASGLTLGIATFDSIEFSDNSAGLISLRTNGIVLTKIQQLRAECLLGNSTGGIADAEEITIGSGLILTGGVLSATGGGGGITSLNTLTTASQDFAVGLIGTDFNIVSTGSTHTFNIPSASSTARGLVTTSAQTFAGNKTFSGQTTFDSGANATPVTITTTNATNTVAALTINANSGTRALIASTNGQAQFAARSTSHTDRELRFQMFSDGHCYFGTTTTTGTVTSDLVIRTSQDAGTNNGAIRFNVGAGGASPARMAIYSQGVSIGAAASLGSPSARLHVLTSQTTTAGTAPLKFTSGASLMTTAEAGAFEYNGTNLFFTPASVRHTVFHGIGGVTAPATAAFATPTSYFGNNITNVLGTPSSWAQITISGATYKIPLYA